MLKRISIVAAGLILHSGQGYADAASDQAYQAGVAAYTAADYQGAIRNAEAAAAADSKNWQAWQLDGNARYALGDKAGAITVYKYALQINPGNTQLKTFVDSLDGAAAQPATAASPAEAAYQSGVAHYTAGDYDTAMKEAAEAVRADPNHWQAWSLLGNCRYARTDKRGALEAYDKSLTLHPDQPQLKPFRDQLAADPGAMPTGGATDTHAAAEEQHPTGWRQHGLFIGVSGGLIAANPGSTVSAVTAVQSQDLGFFGTLSTPKVTPVGSFVGGALHGMLIKNAIGIWIDLGYYPAKTMSVATTATDKFGDAFTDTWTFGMDLFTVDVGAFVEPVRVGPFYGRIMASAGIAHTAIDFTERVTQTGFFTLSSSDTIPLQSYTLALGGGVEGGFDIGRLEFFVGAGYLLSYFIGATTTQMHGDIAAGAYLKGVSDRPIPFNLSGVDIAGGIRYRK